MLKGATLKGNSHPSARSFLRVSRVAISMKTYSGTAYIQWHNKARRLPIFLIRHGSASIKPHSLNLTLRSCWSVYTRPVRLSAPTHGPAGTESAQVRHRCHDTTSHTSCAGHEVRYGPIPLVDNSFGPHTTPRFAKGLHPIPFLFY